MDPKEHHKHHHHHHHQHQHKHHADHNQPAPSSSAAADAQTTEKNIEDNIQRLLALRGGSGPDGHIRVAAYFSPMKAEKLGWPGFVSYASARGVQVELLPLGDATAKGPYDVVLHKLTDELSALEGASDAVEATNTHGEVQDVRSLPQRLEEWQRFASALPQVDPVTAQRITTDRVRFLAALAQLPASLKPVRAVRHHVLEADAPLRDSDGHVGGLPLPVIVKPVRACGSSPSHEMAVCRSVAEVREARGQLGGGALVVQEYADHDGVIFKCFAVGPAHVYTVARPSLRNLPAPPAAGAPPQPLRFHSQKPLPAALDPALDPPVSVPPPSLTAVRDVAGALSQALGGMTLFGFDVVHARASGEYLIVDVNYFPGFKGVPMFAPLLLQLLLETHVRHRKLHA